MLAARVRLIMEAESSKSELRRDESCSIIGDAGLRRSTDFSNDQVNIVSSFRPQIRLHHQAYLNLTRLLA